MRSITSLAVFCLFCSSAFAVDKYRVDQGRMIKIEAHGSCKYVENKSAYAIFIPARTKGELDAFISHTPNGVTLYSCCPEGYIRIPALEPYTTQSFCVAKYEMKRETSGYSFFAASQAEGTPWINIDRNEAHSECQRLGSSYSLISNAQWQTIARNIEQVAANWSGGAVGVGQLNHGHSDNDPASPLAAISDDNQPCFQTRQSCSASIWQSQKRTHVLSTGETIWDFAGNVVEWVLEDASALKPSIQLRTQARWFEYSDLTPEDRNLFGPSDSSWNSAKGIGQLYTPGSSLAGVIRGGAYYSNESNSIGIFYANLGHSPSTVNNLFGFRCVLNQQ